MNFALRLLILSLAVTLLTGVSPQKCDRYAATAVDQAKRNFQGNCGGTGGRWSDDFRSHYDWCLNQTEPGAALKAEQQARDDTLANCKAPAVGTPIFSPTAAPCPSGLVWRERFEGDAACVPPSERFRLEDGTCRSGYVWRDSFSGDNVCVTPAQRAAAKKK
jgi:hypothetical protein